MEWKTGDIVIRKGKHSCEVKFVEGSDDTCLLLVNGVKDEVFTPDEFDLAREKYQLLCKKEDRKDLLLK